MKAQPLTEHSLFCYNAHDTISERVKELDRRRTEVDIMPRDAITQIINVEQLEYVTLLAVQQEVGITQRTFEKYQAPLGIEPNRVHIGTRSFYISREAVANVKQRKQYLSLFAHLKASVNPQATK